jgi:hypothetical protein
MMINLLLLAAISAPCDDGQCQFPILGAPARAVVGLVDAKPVRTMAGNVLERKPIRRGLGRAARLRPLRGVRQAVVNRRQARANRGR